MNKILAALVGFLAIFAALIVGGYHFAGIGGAFGGFVLYVLGIKLMARVVKNRLVRVGKELFDCKSRVLRGATSTVNSVSTAPQPEGAAADGIPPETRFYFVDVTINAPTPDGTTPFASWDPHELMVVPFDLPPVKFDATDAEPEKEHNCQVHNVTYLRANGEPAAEDEPSDRLRLHIGVPKETRRLKFQYYFEMFGDLKMP